MLKTLLNLLLGEGDEPRIGEVSKPKKVKTKKVKTKKVKTEKTNPTTNSTLPANEAYDWDWYNLFNN